MQNTPIIASDTGIANETDTRLSLPVYAHSRNRGMFIGAEHHYQSQVRQVLKIDSAVRSSIFYAEVYSIARHTLSREMFSAAYSSHKRCTHCARSVSVRQKQTLSYAADKEPC